MSELNNRENIINEDDLEKVGGGTGAIQCYYFKCINPVCRQFNHEVAFKLPRNDVKVKCRLCKHIMERQV